MSQKCCNDCRVQYKLAMGGGPQGAMHVASQIWQVVLPSQTLQVFCLALRKRVQYVVVPVISLQSIITTTTSPNWALY